MSIRSCRLAGVIALIGLILLGSSVLTAQSGRKLPKGSPPVETPEPAPQPIVEEKPRPKPQFTLKVMSDLAQGGAGTFMNPSRMHSWVVDRLSRSILLAVRDGGSTGRSDAIKQAKSETEAFVILLELNADPFGPVRSTSGREATMIVTVYHPVSGKVRFSRMLSVGQTSSLRPASSTVLNGCYPSVFRNDILLLETSIAAADLVLNHFNIPLPPVCGGQTRIPGT